MEKILLLVMGAILGAIFSFLLPIGQKKIKGNFQARRLKKRKSLVESRKVYKWLIEYYKRKGNLNDLFDCKIGNFEIKIPFLTKREWQYVEVIKPETDEILEYAESYDQRFKINKRLIKRRIELGQNLFNEPTLYLDRLDEFSDSITLHVKCCEYFQMATQLVNLEEETFEAIQKNIFTGVPIRDSSFPSLLHAQKLGKKPYSIGCTVALVLKTANSYEIIIQIRSHSTLTFGGTKAVIPNFGLSPIIGATNNYNILSYNFIKEYCEEMFNYEELISLMNSKRANPYWFYELPEAKELLSLWEDKVFSLEFLGFGFDALNGTSNIALLAIIDDVGFAKKIKENIITNWEVAKRTMKLEPIEFIDYKSSKLENWLRENRYQFGSAFTIARVIERLETISR